MSGRFHRNPKVIATKVILDRWRELGFEYPHGVKIKFVTEQLVKHLELKPKNPSDKNEVAALIDPEAFIRNKKRTKHGQRMQKMFPSRQVNAVAETVTEEKIKEFYASWEWKRLSFDVKLHRGRKCECCGAAAPMVRIHTDHVKPIRHYWHLRLDKENLQVLCEDCNMGKGSRHETDFRTLNKIVISEPIEDEPEPETEEELRLQAIREQLRLN